MTERERRRRIVEHLRSGEADAAASELAASRETYPGDGALHHVIGMAFATSGTLGQALEQLEAAAQLDPESAEIQADLAQVRLARGESEQAIEAAEQALLLSPNLPLAHFTLGRAHFIAECARQARRPPPPLPADHFSLIDGRAPGYLRALREMETALEAAPPFALAVRAALALGYQRAGHLHAAAEQLRGQLAELPPSEEADQVRSRLRGMEYEIIREAYWAMERTDVPRMAEAAARSESGPEAKLRLAHAYALFDGGERLATALAEARATGCQARSVEVRRAGAGARSHTAVSDAHLLIGGSLEGVVEERLRFLPFAAISQVQFGEVRHWREAVVELTSGQQLAAVVPSLYRLSFRSPSDLIQSGRFTQFSYGPGETRYAYAIGARSFVSDEGVIPFGEIELLAFR